DRGLAGLEEADDLDQQRLVAIESSARQNPLCTEHGRPVTELAVADAPKRADPAPLPDAYRHVGASGVDARHRFTAAPHDSEQGLDAVDPVPEKIGMVRLQGAGSVLIASD